MVPWQRRFLIPGNPPARLWPMHLQRDAMVQQLCGEIDQAEWQQRTQQPPGLERPIPIAIHCLGTNGSSKGFRRGLLPSQPTMQDLAEVAQTMWMDASFTYAKLIAVDYRSQFLFILVEQSHRDDTPILAHFGREPRWRAHYVPCTLHVEELCHLCFVESTSVCIRGETLEPHQIITVLPGTVVDFDSKPVAIQDGGRP